MSRRALLIGIDYLGTPNRLQGCINDVNSIRQTLVSTCNYPERNIITMTEELGRHMPNRRNIIAGIDWLVRGLRRGDTAILYYSGHGSNTLDRSSDEADGRDEMLVPVDFQTAGFITDDWLRTNLAQRIPAGANLYVFMDCCHSGSLLDLRCNFSCLSQPRVPITPNMTYSPTQWSDRFMTYLESGASLNGNVYVFSACWDDQLAAEAMLGGTTGATSGATEVKRVRGAFSYCLQQLIQTKTVGNRFQTGQVRLREALKELGSRLIIHGFQSQNIQLSCNRLTDLELSFSI